MKVIHYGNIVFNKDDFKHITNDNWGKPRGGLWTSPVDSEYGWKEWCTDEEFRDCNVENSFTLELKDSCKILKIDSKEDLINIIYTYKGNYFNKIYLDFETISKYYDAIWLTVKGESETRHCGMFDDGIPCIYGWDCESVLLLNNCCIKEGDENDCRN